MVCLADDFVVWKDFPKGLRVLLLDEDAPSAEQTKLKLEAMDYVGMYSFFICSGSLIFCFIFFICSGFSCFMIHTFSFLIFKCFSVSLFFNENDALDAISRKVESFHVAIVEVNIYKTFDNKNYIFVVISNSSFMLYLNSIKLCR